MIKTIHEGATPRANQFNIIMYNKSYVGMWGHYGSKIM